MGPAFVIFMVCCLFIQILFWFICSFNLKKNKRLPARNIVDIPSVSIVICARNEADNLRKNLPSFLRQKNIRPEVIVVNDNSEDDTGRVLAEYAADYPHLKVINAAPRTGPGKKAALQQGLEAATSSVILLSDADCEPECENWAYLMSREIIAGSSIVGGYSPFAEESSTINAYARFENVITALQYIGLGRAGIPYMGVGRNIGYDRSALRSVGYFESHKNVPSGDDDLTVQSVLGKEKGNTMTFLTSRESFVWSAGPADLRHYIRQKLRHYSVSGRYPIHIGMILGLFVLSWLGFYLSLVVLLWLGLWKEAILLSVAHYGIRFLCWSTIKSALQQRFTLLQIILFDGLYPVLTLFLTIFGLLKKTKHWK